jgi:hypothetical protein
MVHLAAFLWAYVGAPAALSVQGLPGTTVLGSGGLLKFVLLTILDLRRIQYVYMVCQESILRIGYMATHASLNHKLFVMFPGLASLVSN